MPNLDEDKINKIVNPELAVGPLRDLTPHGEFEAIVHVAEPQAHSPYMRILGPYSPGFLKVRIPCSKIAALTDDANVLSIELRAHLSDSEDVK